MRHAFSLGITGFLLMTILFCSAEGKTQKQKFVMYVGTYTGPSSKGIYGYQFDAATGTATELGLVAETENPSFLTIDPTQRFLYSVNEISDFQNQKAGAITSFRIDPKAGKLNFVNQVSSAGAGPCFIAFDRAAKYIFAANYEGGNIAVFPISPDGRLGPATSTIQHSGHGANLDRQEGPHPHWVGTSADNRHAVVADLGLDKLFIYGFDPSTGSLSKNGSAYSLTPGSGPRHFTFNSSGNLGYVINEMGSTVTVFFFDQKDGALHEKQTISTLPEGFKGKNDTAEIELHPNGQFLYASNRGHDSIAVFSVNPQDGTLKNIQYIPSEGSKPRTFEIDPSGSYLVAADQGSNKIVIFTIDQKSGRLTRTGQTIDISSPVCIKFVALR
jgi:6-phosphogluconolactonase